MPMYELYLEEYLEFFVEKEYRPRVDEYELEEDYVAVLVKDDANNYPDTWIAVRYCYGDFESDFCKDIFYLRNSKDRRDKAFQEIALLDSNILWELCSSCAEDYVAENNLLEFDEDEW